MLQHVSILRSSSGSMHGSLLKLHVKIVNTSSYLLVMWQHILYLCMRMLSSKIKSALWAEKTTTMRYGITETATTWNFALWKLQWRQWGFWTESHLQPLSEKVTWP